MEPTTTAVSVTIPGPWQLLMAGAVFAAGYRACSMAVDSIQESINNSIAELEVAEAKAKPKTHSMKGVPLKKPKAKAKPKKKPTVKP